MECGSLKIIDKGKMGILEEVDQIQTQNLIKIKNGTETLCRSRTMSPKDYFSNKKGNHSPMDRLEAIVNSDPEIKGVHPKLLNYIFNQQRVWMRKSTGH